MLFGDVPLIAELFLQYQQEQIRDKNVLVNSGLMVTNQAIQNEFTKGGKTIDLPFFHDLSGDSEIDSDVVPSNPESLTGNVQTGVRNGRRKSWKSSDLAADMSGSDPARAIAASTGRYWVREMQKVVKAELGALFGTNGPLATSHSTGGNSTQLEQTVMVDAVAKLGDAGSDLTAVAMHSATYYALIKLDLVVPASKTSQLDTRLSQESLNMPTYMGKPVFVDDNLPFTAGAGPSGQAVYDTFFFAPGAFGYATAPVKKAVETDRNILVGVDVLVNRTHFLVHPNGMSWKGQPAALFPTNAELGTPSNWEKVFEDDRNIRLTRLRAYV